MSQDLAILVVEMVGITGHYCNTHIASYFLASQLVIRTKLQHFILHQAKVISYSQFCIYRIMQIVHGGKLLRFSRISLQSRRFPANFSFLLAIRCFKLLYNRESFLANNKKIMQPRNFSTANDLHYTVIQYAYLCTATIMHITIV